MKKLMLLFSSAFLLGSITSIADAAKSEESIRQEIKTKQSELIELYQELYKLEKDNTYKIGDTISLTNGLQVTLANIQLAPEDLNDSEKNKFPDNPVRIDIVAENPTQNPQKITSLLFTLYDNERVLRTPESKNYMSLEIAPGMKAEGSIYFNVKHLGKLTIFCEDSSWVNELK